jgi:glycosyltransferase involved in cell wall biosynthesis
MRALVGNAQRVVDQLAEEGAPAERLRVIRNGIDLTRFAGSAPRASTRTALGIRDGTIVLIAVANLIPYKGHEDLIDALAKCSGDLPDWTLLCVGAGEERRQALVARAAGAGLAGRVNFLGRRTDVPDLLAAADIAVLSSHEEGFPNADPAALSDAIRELAADAALRSRMGAAGRARANAEFALGACVARYDDLYARIVDGRPVSGG